MFCCSQKHLEIYEAPKKPEMSNLNKKIIKHDDHYKTTFNIAFKILNVPWNPGGQGNAKNI